jgi:hypothetical protein
MFICLSVYLSARLSVCLSACFCLFVYLHVNVVCLCYLSVCLSNLTQIFFFEYFQMSGFFVDCLCLSVYLSVFQFKGFYTYYYLNQILKKLVDFTLSLRWQSFSFPKPKPYTSNLTNHLKSLSKHILVSSTFHQFRFVFIDECFKAMF